jgi:small-conductance mechanosensitive channel
MMKIYASLVLIVLNLSFHLAFSQEKNISGQDSINDPLQRQSEAAILYQQHILDSLSKIEVKAELQSAQGNSRKTKELEKKLKRIEVQDSLRKMEMKSRFEMLKKNAKGIAVVPFRDTLFILFSKLASVSTQERVNNICIRIQKIYEQPMFKPDSMKVNKTEYGTEIYYDNDQVIMLVSDIDAMFNNKGSYQLATEYMELIKASIVKEREANSLTNWLKRIGLAILILIGLYFLIYLNNKIFRWLNAFIKDKKDLFLRGMTINKVKIFTPEQFESVILKISNLVRIFVIILTVYFSVPLLFSIFPETKMWTSTLLQWVLGPARKALHGIISFLPDLFSIVIIVFIFRFSIRGIKYFVDQIEKGDIHINGFYPDWANPTFRIMKFLLYAFMLVLIFPFLPGSESSAFKGVSVFIGVLFSLGSSSVIANMVAGMVITYMRPFKIGDRVKIGDITGDVMEKTALVTRIRTVKNEDVTVPNSTILLSSTTNFSTNTRPESVGLIVHTTVTIGYDVPWKDMHQALITAALRTDMILKKPEPFVLQTSLDDFYVSYQINGYTKEANKQSLVYSLLHQNIQDCCNEAGIEIMSPSYMNHRDGNMTTIPTNYLDKDYKAPPFNIKQVKEG